MKRLPIRWRLTLWYGSVLTIILLLSGVGIFFLTEFHLLERTDRSLAEGIESVQEELEEASTSSGLQARLHRRFGHYEHLLYDIRYAGESSPLFSRRLSDEPFPEYREKVPQGEPTVSTFRSTSGEEWRIARQSIDGPDGAIVVSVATSLADDQHESWELVGTLAGVGSLAIFAALVGGYFLARRALAPIDRMTQAAQEISGHRLDGRIVSSNADDELGRLAATLNGMIDRLAQSLSDVRQFTADAAHELRTPLAVARTELEVTLRSPRSAEEYRRSLEMLLEEVEQLTQLANQLLSLSREDAQGSRIQHEPVHFDRTVAEALTHFRSLANDKGVEIAAHTSECCVQGDPERLRQLVWNLLHNAVKFTPPGGHVSVRLEPRNTGVVLKVSDSGTGIAQEDQEKVFNRFYRADSARHGAGAGLGLSICQAIVEAHGGSIRVESEVDKGATFVVTLPA
jgi:two-component system heavy metal sensor histidine kinase CusS